MGPSTSQTTPSRFSLLQEMLEEDNQRDSDSSGYSDYNFNYDRDGDNTVTSSMLPISATSGGKKKPKKTKGKGKATTPAPKTIMSSGVSKTPIKQQLNLLETVYADDSDDDLEMSNDMAEKIVGTAVIKVMNGHFTKLYSKIDNLKMELSTLTTTVASVVEENNKLGKVRGNAPDPEKQPPTNPAMVPTTPKKDLTLRP